MSDSILNSVLENRETRIGFIRSIPVYQLEGDTTELLPPGSGVLIIADPNTEAFDALERAVETMDIDGINTVVHENKIEIARLERVSEEFALNKMLSAPVYADLRYNGKPLVVNAFVTEDVKFTRVLFPFAGGSYDKNSFTLAEYLENNDSEQLEAMVVLHQPILNSRERAVLRRLPDASRELVFGTAGETVMSGTPGALVATVTAGLLVAAVGTAIGNCSSLFDDMKQFVINPSEIDIRTPNLAVQKLINARRQLLIR
ncbi:MAG: hypothetical protein Cpurp_01495 [Chlorogloea purpurea SAG 13.99]|nr:hypothetical protein [Chlorogloea purpurea SAG 13.99]